MTAGGPDEGTEKVEHPTAAASDDWNRYGRSHLGRPADQRPRDALGRPTERVDRRFDGLDDLYLYRREASESPVRPEESRGPRVSPNVATVCVVGALAVALTVVALATAPAMPDVTPEPILAVSTSPATPALVSATPYVIQNAGVKVLVDLPLAVLVGGRDWPLDDGKTIYLGGSAGALAVDASTGAILSTYRGPAFAGGVRRAVVDSGLWVSSWPATAGLCGPECWAAATTFRIDLATGKVTNTLAATYLVGAATDGIWVATGKAVERLDPSTAAAVTKTIWAGDGEPRVGCGSLWSFMPGTQSSTIAVIEPGSGAVLQSSSIDPTVAFGPTTVQGQCWMTSGSTGATTVDTTLVWLRSDGTMQASFVYPGMSMVVLDGEFWQYSTDGQLRRFDATSGVPFGTAFALPVHPPNGDPDWLFSTSGSLWMIDGTWLVGFDVPTGAAGASAGPG